MWSRVVALLRARLGGRRETSSLPIGPLLMLAAISALFGDVGRELLPVYAYGVFTLSVSAALIAIPLLGELGAMLRADEAAEWVEALPVAPAELRLARTLHVLIVLGMLAAVSLVPAALLAPEGATATGRAGLVVAGLGQAVLLAAGLLAVQALLGGRAETLLVGAQTVLVGTVFIGGLTGLRLLPRLAPFDSFATASETALAAYPPSWFAGLFTGEATPLGLAAVATAMALIALGVLPEPRATTQRRGQGGLVELAFRPLRAAALRLWVARNERGCFDLVFDALPREREFKLRTYPLLGFPLAFLLGARTEAGVARDILLALICLLPAVYMPVMIMQIPGSQSSRAKWLLEAAPVARASIQNGTIKAVAVRFLVPAFALLGGLTAWVGGVDLLLRYALPGFLISVAALRAMYVREIEDLPLSVPPEGIVARLNWSQIIVTLAFVTSLLAGLMALLITTPLRALIVVAVLLVSELASDRAQRRAALAEA